MTEFQKIYEPNAVAFTRPERRMTWVQAAIERVGPVLAPSAMLLAARWWHMQGAAHSVGDAVISGLLTAGSLVAGTVCAMNAEAGLSKGAGIGLTLAGTFAAAGITAYAGGLALPVLLWAVASGVGIKLAGLVRAAEKRRQALAAEREAERVREEERRELARDAAHERAMEMAHNRSRTKVLVAALDAYARVTVAELDAAKTVAVAELEAGHAHSILPGAERPALPAQPGRRELAALLAEPDVLALGAEELARAEG
jgi:hypothetical protein